MSLSLEHFTASLAICLWDEGTAHVDANAEREIMRNLREMEITCVFATHNEDLLDFADNVIHWMDGKIVMVPVREYLSRRESATSVL